MHETVTIQLGQCGNQIGNEFWKKATEEHMNSQENDRRDKFFYITDDGKLMPRTILMDTEPRAISPTLSTLSNTFLTTEGTGAGNNWAQGYYLAKTNAENILETIGRSVEACDNLESFQVIHSCAGGTGSGFSGFLAEALSELYPKKILNSFSVMPNNNEASDVVIQPYNTVLCLNKLNAYFDSMIIMDNFALSKQIRDSDRKSLTYESLNSIAADVISSFSSSIRFPSYVYCDNRSILNTIVPHNQFKFVVPSFVRSLGRRLTVGEVMGGLVKHKSMLCHYEPSNIHGFFSILNVLEKTEDTRSVMRAQRLIQQKINFIDLPYYTSSITRKTDVNVSLNNSSAVKSIFRKVCGQFDCLRKRKAFLEMYKKFDLEISEMDAAKENLVELSNCYESVEIN